MKFINKIFTFLLVLILCNIFAQIIGANSSVSTVYDEDVLQLMEQAHIPSLSACVIVNDSVKWYDGYGCCRGANTRFFCKKPTIDTIYRVASISKCVTATAILQLYEKGCFDLDENVSKYLPFDLKNPKFASVNITFRMLLNHTSSLTEPNFNSRFSKLIRYFIRYPDTYLKEILTENGRFYSPQIWLNDSGPGESYEYSNIGFAVLEYLIERVSDRSFENYCKENIFEPLDMKNTSFHIYDFKRKQIAAPYIWWNNIFIRLPNYDFRINSGAGGMLASVEDLSHFLIAHMNNGTYKGVTILNESTISLMHNESGRSYYGLGWRIRSDSSGHRGIGPGFRAEMWMYHSNNTGIIYFWNQYNTNNPDPELDDYFTENFEKILLKIAIV